MNGAHTHREEIPGLLRELRARIRQRELQRQHGAGKPELEHRRAEIARLRWRLAAAVRESALETARPGGGAR